MTRTAGAAGWRGPSQAKRSRYSKTSANTAATERLFIDMFLEAHSGPLKQIILDLNATEDPLHGHQETVLPWLLRLLLPRRYADRSCGPSRLRGPDDQHNQRAT
jgi:hypothetical protein